MFNPIHIVVILSFLAGWHLDAIDQALIEKHKSRLAPLNHSTEQPALIQRDNNRFTVLPVE